jgi:hypothetical protein
MARRLKVFGGNFGGRWRAIMAATSFAEFTRATRITREYGAETQNPDELAQAMGSPGTLYLRPYDRKLDQTWVARLRADRQS